MKLTWPAMLHVTMVRSPSGLKVNSAVLVDRKGLWKSFTCAKTAGAGAEMVAVRATRYSDGRVATIARNTKMIPASAMRTLMSIVGLPSRRRPWRP